MPDDKRLGFAATHALLVAVTLSAIARGAEIGVPPPAELSIDYGRDVRPVLARSCLHCHGPDEQESNFRVDVRATLLAGGDSDEPAVLSGNSTESPLVRRVSGVDEDLLMPPVGEGKRLSPDEISLLRAWIDQGAPIPDKTGEESLATNHWSLQTVLRPAVPDVDDARIANPVDAFILERLRDAGLAPSPPADRASLVRRLYLDMLGLLPTPEVVRQFVADDSPRAYAELVDQVLASPHYGERWARHWLDVVRFAESDGFETNHDRPDAFHYRDWVVRALNDDMPYDQFVFAQLAGDTIGQDAATGFLVGGPYDIVKSPDPTLTLMQRQDELADMINTTGTAFLGLTLGCARCHTHKFDPILQKDYYSLQAVFAGVQHGTREMQLSPEGEEERRQQVERLDGTIARLQAELAELQPESFAGQLLLVDDEHAERTSLLAEKQGHGENPDGDQRGQKSDRGGPGRLPNISGGRYTWWNNRAGLDVMAYRPQSPGRWRVWLSWGCGWRSHSTDAEYLVDADGDLATKDDQVLIATVDQQRFRDETGQPENRSLWSGFYNAGVHELGPQSVILLRGGSQGSAITADVIVLEEATRTEAPDEFAAPRLSPPVHARQNIERFVPIEANFVRFIIAATNSSEPCIDELEIWTAGDAPRNVALASAGSTASSSGNHAGNPKHKLEHIHDGRYGNDRSWISNTNGSGWVQIELPEPVLIDRIVWGRDRKLKYGDRLATEYRIDVATEPGHWQTVATHQRRVPFGLGPADALPYRTIGLSADDAKVAARLGSEIDRLETDRARLLNRPTVYAGKFTQPSATHRLYRGDPMAPREQVPPETLAALHAPVGALDLDVDAPEQQRRVELARWISSTKNPLTARVIVNRLWHYHFGCGIVATPSDFGAMGFPPTHPGLLDWLAAELMQPSFAGHSGSGEEIQPWSLKHIHRLILLSATFRQSSRPRADGMQADGDSALLWRFPPRRVEAEAIRDNILLVSGALDPSMYGPGFMLFEPDNNYSRHWVAKDEFGHTEFRRMIYALDLRMEHDAVFGAFDCPDGGQVTPRRTRSTTPIQALNLFNSNFVVQVSEQFARRVIREAGEDPISQVRRAAELALLRKLNDEELADATSLVENHGLPALCRAMFNSNEFLFMP
jgi:hypothetical protein